MLPSNLHGGRGGGRGGREDTYSIHTKLYCPWCLLVAQIVDVVYRKPTGVLPGESHSHIEAEQSHIQSFVNFVSSFSWANMVLRSRP